ncbi:MAG: DUF5990 family protein [Ferruginibacter sp.]
MKKVLRLRIIVEQPTSGVIFGLQKGKGTLYETIQKQEAKDKDLAFEFDVAIKIDPGKPPVLLGPFVQGKPTGKFIYVDIGRLAGQKNSQWERRLKIPLPAAESGIIHQSLAEPGCVIETIVPGFGKDGSPNCGTVKPFNGWKRKALP